MLTYATVVSGIDAPAVGRLGAIMIKKCAKCKRDKPLSEFHKQPTGPMGRHSWCKVCANAAQKASREKNGRCPNKRKWNLSTRYGLAPEQFKRMKINQDHQCLICREHMKRICIDHNHKTGRVRGLLCHGCNIKLSAIEDSVYRESAMQYLSKYEVS